MRGSQLPELPRQLVAANAVELPLQHVRLPERAWGEPPEINSGKCRPIAGGSTANNAASVQDNCDTYVSRRWY